MASVRLTETAEATLKGFGPSDQKSVAWAVSLLEDDDHRQSEAFDLAHNEEGFPVWAFVVGNIFMAFVESEPDEVTVVHLSLLSGFGYRRGGY